MAVLDHGPTGKPTTTKARESYGRIDDEGQVMYVATTKTTMRKATAKRATSTNGTKTAKKASTKRKKPMTANEALLIAWQHDYETRHGKAKSK
jgi:hypothetical protein